MMQDLLKYKAGLFEFIKEVSLSHAPIRRGWADGLSPEAGPVGILDHLELLFCIFELFFQKLIRDLLFTLDQLRCPFIDDQPMSSMVERFSGVGFG